MITAGPIVSAEAASGPLGGLRARLSPSAPGLYWACQVSEKNLRAENSLQTGLGGWPRAVKKDARSSVGGDARPGWGVASPQDWPPQPRSGTTSLDVPAGGICRKGLWFRAWWTHTRVLAQVGQPSIFVCVSLRDTETALAGWRNLAFWSCPLALSCAVCENAN